MEAWGSLQGAGRQHSCWVLRMRASGLTPPSSPVGIWGLESSEPVSQEGHGLPSAGEHGMERAQPRPAPVPRDPQAQGLLEPITVGHSADGHLTR